MKNDTLNIEVVGEGGWERCIDMHIPDGESICVEISPIEGTASS